MLVVARDDGEAVDQCRRCNHLVERVLRTRRAQVTLNLRHVGTDIQDVAREIRQDGSQPTLKAPRLQRVTAMADQLDTATQLVDGDDRQEQRLCCCPGICKKPSNICIGPMALAYLVE